MVYDRKPLNRKSSLNTGASRRYLMNSRGSGLLMHKTATRGLDRFSNKTGGLRSGNSLEVLRKAYEDLARSPSPELEEKDEFAASSLW